MQRLCLVAVGALACTAMAQSTLVTPNGYASTAGNTNNTYPWARNTASMRIQFLVDSTHFTNQGVVSPIIISQLRYRPYAQTTATAATWTGGTWPNVRIDMATSPLDWSLASTTYANNLGADVTTVLNGPVTVVGGTTPGVGVVCPWYITIPLTTPFLYDPTSGNDLTLDIQLDGTGWTGTSRAADHVTGATGVGGPALGCRIFNTTSHTATTGTIGTAYGAVTEFTYVPASGLYAGFNANVTGGPSPLAVNFTSTSYSSDPGGISGYAWDFDGDSVIDSTVQNPTHTYTNCGTYTVSLTVFDATHPPSTLTKNAYIKTDVVTADFTLLVTGPLTVQFTDTSTPAATSWAWDFDGDSVIDSTAQNPIHVYPYAGTFAPSLTVTRLCSAPSTAIRAVNFATGGLTTNLAANNGVGTPATLYYNLDVLNPQGVSIQGFDTITSTISTPFTVDCYLKVGTHVGSELNPAPWTQVGTAYGVTAAVANQPALSAFQKPVYLPAGSYGVALRYVGAYPRYVTQTTPLTWSTADLSLTAGSASLSTAGPFTGTNLNSPRGWAGTVYYVTQNTHGVAGHGFFAPGCAGTLGVSHQTYVTRPAIGSTMSVQVGGLPFGVAVMVIGVTRFPVPVDLGIIGAPGCPLYISLDATETLVSAPPTATWNFGIPNVPAIAGTLLYNQAAVLDPAANPFGFVMGDGAGWVVGTL
ncbi:MAG TPA: PKD domain-containing protein [Planctomycetota bacterium]